MADDDLLDMDHKGEKSFRPDRYTDAKWQKALKLLIKENIRWKTVSRDDFIEIVGVDDKKRSKMLKDISKELKYGKDELGQLESSIRDALAEAGIKPAHWFK